mmetsp:Transcript_11389/g.17020  ORF Transcript_11389/g.17020 Transcript_11389/m.17020 type:complete len:1021 (-) Transcript_11389:138-3200(-)
MSKLSGKITTEIVEKIVSLLKECRVRFNIKEKFTPQPREWILLINSAPDLMDLHARIIVVGGLQILCENLEDLAKKGATKDVEDFLLNIEKIVQGNKDKVFTNPEEVKGPTAAEVIQHCRGTGVKVLGMILEHYEHCLEPQESVDELSRVLNRACKVWVDAIMPEMKNVRNFLLQGDLPQLFSNRPLIDGKMLHKMVTIVHSTVYGLQGGSTTSLLKEFIQKKIVSSGIEDLCKNLASHAKSKPVQEGKTRFTVTTLRRASIGQKKPRTNASNTKSKASQESQLTTDRLKTLLEYLRIRNGCNIFRENMDFNARNTINSIARCMGSIGSVRELIVSLAILQTQNVKAHGFQDLEDKVNNSEVMMFRQKVKDELLMALNKNTVIGSESVSMIEESETIEPETQEKYVENPNCQDWKEAKRQSDGKVYYWNVKTKKTKWKRPKCLRERDAYLEREKARELARNKEKKLKKESEEEKKSPKDNVNVSDEMVTDILYAGRLRTMAILPILQAPETSNDFKILSKQVEEGVKKLFEREEEEMKTTIQFLREKTILTVTARLRTSQLYRLVRAGLYTDYGLGGGSVRDLLESLHSAHKRYRKFSDLVGAVKRHAADLQHAKERERARGMDQDLMASYPNQLNLLESATVTVPGGKVGDDLKGTIMILGPPEQEDSQTSLVSSVSSFTSPKSSAIVSRIQTPASTTPSATTPVAKRSPMPIKKSSRVNKKKIKWKKVKELGRGAFGVVIWGIDIRTGQSIAIKQIRLRSKQDIEKAKEVEREVRTLKNLSHPNIVELYAVERVGAKLNIIMEYVPSNSIDWVIKKIGKLDDHYMARVTAQVLEALIYCHKQNLIHRDIKGKNILVDNFGNAKLADFGSAMLASDSEMQKENAEYTPLWAAPEMVKGDGKYNTKVDIWSLGCTVVEMASGKEPWAECNFANPFMALYSIGHTEKIPEIPKMTEHGHDFALKCLTRDNKKRPSAEELRDHIWIKDVLTEEDTDDEGEVEENVFSKSMGANKGGVKMHVQ